MAPAERFRSAFSGKSAARHAAPSRSPMIPWRHMRAERSSKHVRARSCPSGNHQFARTPSPRPAPYPSARPTAPPPSFDRRSASDGSGTAQRGEAAQPAARPRPPPQMHQHGKTPGPRPRQHTHQKIIGRGEGRREEAGGGWGVGGRPPSMGATEGAGSGACRRRRISWPIRYARQPLDPLGKPRAGCEAVGVQRNRPHTRHESGRKRRMRR